MAAIPLPDTLFLRAMNRQHTLKDIRIKGSRILGFHQSNQGPQTALPMILGGQLFAKQLAPEAAAESQLDGTGVFSSSSRLSLYG